MGYGFKVDITGDYALFSRPELKVERVSYDCITPSAARGILEAVFWKPAIRYVVDEIKVVNEVRFINVRRNEINEKISARNMAAHMNGTAPAPHLYTKEAIAQRASLLLREVHYVVSAHFDLTEEAGEADTPEKFYNMILRRLRNGQCFHQPYLGCREFPAKIRLVEDREEIPSELRGEWHLGLMLYDMDYSDPEDIRPAYFQARLVDGVLDLRNVEVLR